MWLRRIIYRLGGRPHSGSIFFSPSLSFMYAFPALKKDKK